MTQVRHTPSLALSLVPVVVLVLLLAGSVAFFGDSSSSGPNQIALILARDTRQRPLHIHPGPELSEAQQNVLLPVLHHWLYPVR